MKYNKLRLHLLCVFCVLFIVAIGIHVSMINIDRLCDNNTAAYSATIEQIRLADTGENIYAAIQTEEYAAALQISTNVSKHLDKGKLTKLQSGQTVQFWIERAKVDYLQDEGIVDIVSLQTETDVIFSLQDYNEFIRDAAMPGRVLSAVLALVFLVLSVWCIWTMKAKKV